MNKIYLYKLYVSNGEICRSVYKIFNNEDEMIAFLRYYQQIDYPKVIDRKKYFGNEFLDNINIVGTDVTVERKWYDGYLFIDATNYLRPWMFVDSSNRVIDARMYYKEILKDARGCKIYPWDRYHYKRRNRQYRHYHSGNTSRRCKHYKHIAKDRLEKEYYEYTRRKYANSIDCWPEAIRRVSSNWKDQSKKRHQWE